VLNLPEPLTYVYRGPGQSSTAAVNQALAAQATQAKAKTR